MIADLEPYPAMKDFGVRWLGDVPEHWEIHQLGRIGRFFKGIGGTKEDEVPSGVPCVRYGDLYMQHQYFIRESRSRVSEQRAVDYTPIQYGDVLFAGSGETIEEIGKSAVNLISRHACCGGDVIIFRSQIEVDASFLGYATDCPQAAHQKSCMGRGVTVMHIYGDELKYMWVAIPPLSEQAAIVRFLDYFDRRIRRYIRAKQKRIALLEEEKQAIIHQAVTGQVDVRTGQPYPAYKPSGVEWLGDVPEHWELRRVKQSAQVLRGKFTHRPRNDPSLYDGPYPFIQTGEVARAERAITNYRQTLNERGLAVSRMFPAGTLVMTIAANIGDVAILDFEACFPDSVVGFVPRNGLERDFLYYVFRAMKPELLREAPVNTQGNLNIDRIGSRGIAIAPALEQRLIVRQIEASMARLKTVTDQARREISLLREYRTRLIADVVTGKVDVRETVAGLPEVDPLAGEFDALTTQAAETGMLELGEATETPEELAMENEVTI